MDSKEFTTGCPIDATPLQLTSLDDTLPVGDVHALTTAASISYPEVSPPTSFESHQLKITRAPVEGSHPGLRIQGRWLTEAGFSIGEHVQISVSWRRLHIAVLHPDCVTQRPTTREERQLALKDTLLSRRTNFAAASQLTRSCSEAPPYRGRHPRCEEGSSRVEDSAELPRTLDAPRMSKQPQGQDVAGGTWPDKIAALLKPALGDVLHQEQNRRRLRPEWIGARAQVGQRGYAAIEQGKSQSNLSKFIAIAWALDQDPRVLFDRLLTQMGFPDGRRPVM